MWVCMIASVAVVISIPLPDAASPPPEPELLARHQPHTNQIHVLKSQLTDLGAQLGNCGRPASSPVPPP